MTISPARMTEFAEAFALLYGWSVEEREGGIAHAFQLVARGELNPNHLLVARDGEQIVGSVFGQPLAGGIAVVVPPRTRTGDSEIEDRLLSAILEQLQGTKVLQAFIDLEEEFRGESLLRAGFRRTTCVMQMQRSASALETLQLPDSGALSLMPYPDATPEEFSQTLMSALRDSLDCPEMQGLLTANDVLEGYRESAPDVARWSLAFVAGKPVGVMILGEGELHFVGVAPEERGRGIGTALVRDACSQGTELSLIVDERNEPAIRMYTALGFEPQSIRAIYLFSQSFSAGDLSENTRVS